MLSCHKLIALFVDVLPRSFNLLISLKYYTPRTDFFSKDIAAFAEPREGQPQVADLTTIDAW
jgi:hypothetical protein